MHPDRSMECLSMSFRLASGAIESTLGSTVPGVSNDPRALPTLGLCINHLHVVC